MKIQEALLLLICLPAGISDAKDARISNRLVLIAGALCFLLRILQERLAGAISFLSVLAMVTALLFPLFFFRAIGAGDIKLLSVLAALLGLPTAWRFLLDVLAVAGCFSAFSLLRKRMVKERFLYLASYVQSLLTGGTKMPYRLEGARPENMPLGPSLILGALLFILQTHL